MTTIYEPDLFGFWLNKFNISFFAHSLCIACSMLNNIHLFFHVKEQKNIFEFNYESLTQFKLNFDLNTQYMYA